MAPEMFSDAEVTHQVDIYSLGIVGFHCLTGHPPFDGPTPMAILYKQAHEQPPALSKLAPKVSPHLCSVIHRAIEKDPQDRFASVAEFAQALSGKPANNGRLWTGLLGAALMLGVIGWGLRGFEQQERAIAPPDLGVIQAPAQKPQL